eukprot:1457579-Amphidinium_carterae.1
MRSVSGSRSPAGDPPAAEIPEYPGAHRRRRTRRVPGAIRVRLLARDEKDERSVSENEWDEVQVVRSKSRGVWRPQGAWSKSEGTNPPVQRQAHRCGSRSLTSSDTESVALAGSLAPGREQQPGRSLGDAQGDFVKQMESEADALVWRLTPPNTVNQVEGDADILLFGGCALGFLAQGQPVHVLGVEEGSQAAAEGITTDSLLLRIDAQETTRMTPVSLLVALQNAKCLEFVGQTQAASGGEDEIDGPPPGVFT